jgi:NAD(P)-dependent dehydrogenase (short-subunit alcohol dehydrogenase family)
MTPLLLREDLLAGRTVAVGPGVSAVVTGLLSGLGASLRALDGAAGAAAGGAVGGAVGAIVHDAGPEFAEGGGAEALAAALEQTWDAVAAVAAGSLIPEGAGGKVVLIAPRAGAGRHAEPARAGLENLARTLSIEWARYGITATAIAPGATTSEDDVALLVAYLLSSAGDYFSGCRFELGAVR